MRCGVRDNGGTERRNWVVRSDVDGWMIRRYHRDRLQADDVRIFETPMKKGE